MKGILKWPARMLVLFPLVALASEPPVAQKIELVLDILRTLDINSFPNSLRQRHLPPGATLMDTPFNVLEKVDGLKDAYSASDKDLTWFFSVNVIEDDERGTTICFVDKSLRGTYFSSVPLVVKRNASGGYVVSKMLPMIRLCEVGRS
ncbi:hypothetical protein [Pseudomonas fragi]|uniref:hypothetical protein n=1 Tax=Pseudomonas fragi TaxID=296 RepID=UPI00200694B2|nr:hypothetical protein [Pseudomonas fragi]MCK6251248.1 hypothetical protein [Pseudomonas fragi]